MYRLPKLNEQRVEDGGAHLATLGRDVLQICGGERCSLRWLRPTLLLARLGSAGDPCGKATNRGGLVAQGTEDARGSVEGGVVGLEECYSQLHVKLDLKITHKLGFFTSRLLVLAVTLPFY